MEVIEVTEAIEAVEVIEAAEVPDEREITQNVKCLEFLIYLAFADPVFRKANFCQKLTVHKYLKSPS